MNQAKTRREKILDAIVDLWQSVDHNLLIVNHLKDEAKVNTPVSTIDFEDKGGQDDEMALVAQQGEYKNGS